MAGSSDSLWLRVPGINIRFLIHFLPAAWKFKIYYIQQLQLGRRTMVSQKAWKSNLTLCLPAPAFRRSIWIWFTAFYYSVLPFSSQAKKHLKTGRGEQLKVLRDDKSIFIKWEQLDGAEKRFGKQPCSATYMGSAPPPRLNQNIKWTRLKDSNKKPELWEDPQCNADTLPSTSHQYILRYYKEYHGVF